VDFENKLNIPNIKKIMTTWTKQMGHPIINVKIINETKVILTQNHFLLDPSTKITEPGVHNKLEYIFY
jgi:aminopeptidase N